MYGRVSFQHRETGCEKTNVRNGTMDGAVQWVAAGVDAWGGRDLRVLGCGPQGRGENQHLGLNRQ